MLPINCFASSPRTLDTTFWGELEFPKKAPPNFVNRAESPPLVPSEEATVFGSIVTRNDLSTVTTNEQINWRILWLV